MVFLYSKYKKSFIAKKDFFFAIFPVKTTDFFSQKHIELCKSKSLENPAVFLYPTEIVSRSEDRQNR